MVRTARDGHFQVACTKFFELTRGKTMEELPPGGLDVIEHPNAWFDLSFKGLKGPSHSQVKAEPDSQPPSEMVH
jgi:hypothetical protein